MYDPEEPGNGAYIVFEVKYVTRADVAGTS
jgi:hypothetical protein